MNRSFIRCGAVIGMIGLAACDVEVANVNEPSRTQIKLQVADLENFLGTQYRRWHSALYGATGNIWGMANVMSFENFSTLSNNCQGQRVGIPRPINDNQVGSPCSGEQSLIYNRASEVARGASDVLLRMDEPDFTFGTAGKDARNRAFAHFLRGISLGYLAMVYDSAAIVSPSDPVAAGTAQPQELSHYTAVVAAALEALDNALAAAPGMEALAANWMFWAGTGTGTGASAMPEAEFVRIVRSYRARIRANVARTPAERAAVDWSAVIADAQNGITADHRIVTTATSGVLSGPNNTWVNQWYAYVTWHQMTPFIAGMADTSGAYAAWLAEPLTVRGASAKFFMITPDQRFPQGETRAAQQADFTLAGSGTAANAGCSGANQTCKRFFRNRDVSDPPASPAWGGSQYDHTRHYSWRTAGAGGVGQTGPFPFFTKAELDLLAAEGHFRKGEYAQAAALVNVTRTACGPGGVPAGCTPRPAGNGRPGDPGGGLLAVTDDANAAVPGGAAGCVPKLPVNASNAGGGTVTCGTLWDALKWEK
ncbi:MAG TPA: hypothetical protein VGA78_13480, partial [Gemmatimonadales bacterium]